MSITDKIKTIEDAYAAQGLVMQDEIPFAEPKNGRQLAANSFMNAMVLTEALNEGWVPDYDTNEDKYEIWWYMRSEAAGGPGFSFLVYYCDLSGSRVGARLVFRTRQLARYAGETFPEVYKDFITIPKG